MQTKLVKAARREDGWSLDAVELRTEKNQVLEENQVLGEATCGRTVVLLDSGAGGLSAGKLGS